MPIYVQRGVVNSEGRSSHLWFLEATLFIARSCNIYNLRLLLYCIQTSQIYILVMGVGVGTSLETGVADIEKWAPIVGGRNTSTTCRVTKGFRVFSLSCPLWASIV